MKSSRVVSIFFCFLLSAFYSVAQEAVKPRPSPLAISSARYKNTYLKITYSQPHKRERVIFGEIVPWGAIWRTGANEATELTVTQDILFNNQVLKAGTYSVFTIPDKDTWTIILNSDLGMWGAYNYNSKVDVLRTSVPVKIMQSAVYEAFTITIEQKNNIADIVLAWDSVQVRIPIQFNEPKP
ncbi:MAG: DUF2911 domain-containing protein [Cyclobacteriaceae bacterium]|nr:DUF2911 domain-containing protein [Cyclobacteriaceae bacterium]